VPLTAAFYKTVAGNEAVRTWLQSLPKGVRKTIGEDIGYVERMWPIGKPLVDGFGEGLWRFAAPTTGATSASCSASSGARCTCFTAS
jgi:hypothetical protein